MCGFAGCIAFDAGALRAIDAGRMNDAILFRGRDDQARWTDDAQALLLHTRLSIIDIQTGRQPMTDVSGRYVIVFTGEIYNFPELREEYRRLGAEFRTNSDTEVILAGYRLKGRAVCRELNGMFAFAIWDRADRQLFLARDRLGKKPLFWTSVGGVFHFASTLDAFRAIDGWKPDLSETALSLYGVLGSFPDNTTVYKHAWSLPPACHATVAPGAQGISAERYWRLDFTIKSRRTLPSLLSEYEEILTDAVRVRLRSDVPLALTFSGGVDSGSIAAICAKKLKTPLTCYTVDYHTADDPSEEALIAKRAAEHLALDWRLVQFDYHLRLLPELEEAYAFYDQPCQQLPLVYAYRLYQAIKPYATVVLSGNGADELFTGYVGDERIRQKGLVLQAAGWLRPLLRRAPVSPYLRMPLPAAYAEVAAARLGTEHGEDAVAGARRVLDRLAANALEAGAESALDLRMFLAMTCTTSDSNYRIPDISGLAAQVEVRSPYLDYRMVEFAARVPDRYKIGNVFSARRNKFLPKKYYASVMPADIAWSRKKGMGFNIRWDKSIVRDGQFDRAFAGAYDAIENSGIPASRYRNAWRGYVSDITGGREFSPHAEVMMYGFMLGAWLSGKDRAGNGVRRGR